MRRLYETKNKWRKHNPYRREKRDKGGFERKQDSVKDKLILRLKKSAALRIKMLSNH